MIYFISDTHLGHNNIIKYCNRPFKDVHEMNKTILDNINEVVGYDDTLYVLGDFCFRGKKPLDYRVRINCRDVHLIFGNHDKRTDYYLDEITTDMNGFSSLYDVKEIIYCNQKIYLSHYPHRSWPASHKGSYMLYGHVHSRLNDEDKLSNRLTLDVGVDNTINYNKPFGQPWSFKELQKLFNRKEPNSNYE
jgi:calcineurin-like phosphoesterase family protein